MEVAYFGMRFGRSAGIESIERTGDEIPNRDLTIVSLRVSGRFNSRLDSMCVLSVVQDGCLQEFCRTEVVQRDATPTWSKPFLVALVLEHRQPLQFSVYNMISGSQDFVGSCLTDVHQIVSRTGERVAVDLLSTHMKGRRGSLVIEVEQLPNCAAVLRATIGCRSLPKNRTFAKDFPFFVLQKGSIAEPVVFRSEVLPKCYGGDFRPFSIPLQILCDCNPASPITVTVYDLFVHHPPMLIGWTTTTVSGIEAGSTVLLSVKKGAKKGAAIKFSGVEVTSHPTFFEYVRNCGVSVNLLTAIDYTRPVGEMSFHRLVSAGKNSYEEAIDAVGALVCPWDKDDRFEVWGFGGGKGDCFPLTFNTERTSLNGLEGVLALYRGSLSGTGIRRPGPAVFAPVLRLAIGRAADAWSRRHAFTVILVLTDGLVSDVRETIDAVLGAPVTSFCILIVGIGGADFSPMGEIVRCTRPALKFAPLRQFQRNMEDFSEVLLGDLAIRVRDFCFAKGLKPLGQ
jgi:hypothetical protein